MNAHKNIGFYPNSRETYGEHTNAYDKTQTAKMFNFELYITFRRVSCYAPP